MGKIDLKKLIEGRKVIVNREEKVREECALGKHFDEKVLGQIFENGQYRLLCRCRACGEKYERIVIDRSEGGFEGEFKRRAYR